MINCTWLATPSGSSSARSDSLGCCSGSEKTGLLASIRTFDWPRYFGVIRFSTSAVAIATMSVAGKIQRFARQTAANRPFKSIATSSSYARSEVFMTDTLHRHWWQYPFVKVSNRLIDQAFFRPNAAFFSFCVERHHRRRLGSPIFTQR